MNTYLRLDGSLALQRFLREHATRHAKWREFKAWRIPGKEGFVVEWPAGLAAPVAAGCTTAPLQPSMAAQPHFLLGDTWKRARPIPRDGRGHMAPSCYLLVVEGDIEHATKALVQQAPAELEFVTLSIDSSDDPKQLSGFLVHGEAGRMAASAPPYGCVSFECDEIRGGLAAFPIGWTAPPLLEELWP